MSQRSPKIRCYFSNGSVWTRNIFSFLKSNVVCSFISFLFSKINSNDVCETENIANGLVNSFFREEEGQTNELLHVRSMVSHLWVKSSKDSNFEGNNPPHEFTTDEVFVSFTEKWGKS